MGAYQNVSSVCGKWVIYGSENPWFDPNKTDMGYQYQPGDWDSHLDEFLVIEYRQIMDKVGEVSKMGEKASQYVKCLRHFIFLDWSHCKRPYLTDYLKLLDSSSWLSLSE